MAGADASWLSRIPERSRATLGDGCLLLCLPPLPQQAVQFVHLHPEGGLLKR